MGSRASKVVHILADLSAKLLSGCLRARNMTSKSMVHHPEISYFETEASVALVKNYQDATLIYLKVLVCKSNIKLLTFTEVKLIRRHGLELLAQ